MAYRVKAYDSAGAESAYKTSATRTVINNTPPTISGTDTDLGAKTGAFDQKYTVTDPDSGQTITVVEKIDGTQKRSYAATSGQEYTFSVTADEWRKLLNGSHTLTVTATDNYGGAATRTYTFSKNETEIELTLATPLEADDMVTKAIMSITRADSGGRRIHRGGVQQRPRRFPRVGGRDAGRHQREQVFPFQRQQDGGGMGIQFPNQGEAEQRKRGLLYFIRGREF